MIFKETKFNNKYCEIGQTLDMKFAFVYKKGNVLTNTMQWTKCRDFLGDALHAEQAKISAGIYDFYWHPKINKMYKTKLKFAIKFPTPESLKNFIWNFDFYKDMLATECKVPFGNMSMVLDKELIVVVEAPAFWKRSVAAISLYTFFMKCFGYTLNLGKPFIDAVAETTTVAINWKGETSVVLTTEAKYLSEVGHNLPKFMNNIKKLTARLPTVHGHPKEVGMPGIHNNSGFHSIIKWGSGLVGQRFKELS